MQIEKKKTEKNLVQTIYFDLINLKSPDLIKSRFNPDLIKSRFTCFFAAKSDLIRGDLLSKMVNLLLNVALLDRMVWETGANLPLLRMNRNIYWQSNK